MISPARARAHLRSLAVSSSGGPLEGEFQAERLDDAEQGRQAGEAGLTSQFECPPLDAGWGKLQRVFKRIHLFAFFGLRPLRSEKITKNFPLRGCLHDLVEFSRSLGGLRAHSDHRGRTGVRAKAVIPLQARNSFHRPKHAFNGAPTDRRGGREETSANAVSPQKSLDEGVALGRPPSPVNRPAVQQV